VSLFLYRRPTFQVGPIEFGGARPLNRFFAADLEGLLLPYFFTIRAVFNFSGEPLLIQLRQGVTDCWMRLARDLP